MAPRTAGKAKLSHQKPPAKKTEPRAETSSDSSSSEVEAEVASASAAESDEEGALNDEVSESESESEPESGSSSETEAPEPKKQKKGDGFGQAMDAILGSRVKAHDAADPILIRNRRSAREIEEARSEARARRALRAEKQQFKDRAHVPDVVPKDTDAAGEALQHEKILRRTAQRGVVKLMNAIHNAQLAASTADGKAGTKQAAAKEDEISKEKFLDMIRMG